MLIFQDLELAHLLIETITVLFHAKYNPFTLLFIQKIFWKFPHHSPFQSLDNKDTETIDPTGPFHKKIAHNYFYHK